MKQNRLMELLGIDQPVVLAPFGGLSAVELTAAVSRLGGLGSYGLYGYTPARITETMAQLHAATQEPFAVNLWLPTGTEATPEETGEVALAPSREVVGEFFTEMGLEAPELPDSYLPDFEAQFDAVVAGRPAAVSFVYGVPPRPVISRAHDAGIVVLGTATTPDEAVALAQGGVDVIVATGAEAAGHRPAFLHPAEDSLVGTFALVPQIVDAVSVPVLAAGGIADRRGVAAALALGASGVQVGTAFLATRQSAANDAHREAIRTTAGADTVLTRAMSGRLARGASNRAVQTIEAAAARRTDAIAPFPAQNWLTGQFRREAGRREAGQLQSLWLGQAAPLVRQDSAEAVFTELLAGAQADPG